MLISFTEEVETFVPPKKGRKHVLRVITEILEQSATGRGTDIGGALEYLSQDHAQEGGGLSDLATSKTLDYEKAAQRIAVAPP